MFKSLDSLKDLYLTDNLLIAIESEMTNAYHINLGSNRIRFIGRNTFSNMYSLNVLLLENNYLIEFDPYSMLPFKRNTFIISTLKHLNLRNNSMSSLAEFRYSQFLNKNSFVEIDLSFNHIKSNFFKIDYLIRNEENRLIYLRLNNIKLSMIKRAWFANMLKLEFLRIDSNLIKYRANNRFLINLNLSNNILSKLNENAITGGLFQLRVLDLIFNKIEFISRDLVADMRNLLTF
jgi:hypothetical protein